MSASPGPLESLVHVLSLDELAALTAGIDAWRTTNLPERGIPRLKMTDGPVGARGESFTSTTSALFPCGSALGATFDPTLVERVGAALGAEARTKGAHVLLGPTLNIQRHPLGGRNFESFGEDPLVVGTIAAALVSGLQRTGVAACIKHLVANDAEIERLTISSEIDERTLREVYLLPFELALRDGGAWSIMASYNRLNGVFACENRWLLTDVVRSEWGFDGLVVSDWFATHDTVSGAHAGIDLEMPGPPRHFGPALADAVRSGAVREDDVRDMATRVLRLADRVGASVADEAITERSEDDPGRWALAVEAAAAATVLLANRAVDGRAVLPIDVGSVGRVAVFGPDADHAVVQGGGSARVNPHRTMSPLAALRARLAPDIEVVHAAGCTRGAPLPILGGPVGIEYRARRDGAVLATATLTRFDPVWSGRFDPAVDPERFHVRAQATVTATTSGAHAFDLMSVGPCTVQLDGRLLLDNRDPRPGPSFFGYGSLPVHAHADLVAGRRYVVDVEYDRTTGNPAMAGIRLGMQRPLGDDPLGEAATMAADADVAIVVVGTNEDVETEGIDRATMGLPGEQDELVRRVAAANPRTIVVVVAGAAIDMPWADDVAAIVVSWFGGMGAGEAMARVLVGDDEPAGRLPITIPRSVSDAPCDISRGDPPGELHYTEGLAVGHRWYLHQGMQPRWWFGAGHGYTSFAWGVPTAPDTWDGATPLAMHVPVRNTGTRNGSEVVQVYLHRPEGEVPRPAWVLGGFARVTVPAGATVDTVVAIDPLAVRHWDDEGGWIVEPGRLELRVAHDAGDPGERLSVSIERGP
jgi:beta-glucosidase